MAIVWLLLIDVSIDFHGFVYNFSMVLVYTNSSINPFIYAAKYREFQRGVRRLISKLKLNKHSNQEDIDLRQQPNRRVAQQPETNERLL